MRFARVLAVLLAVCLVSLPFIADGSRAQESRIEITLIQPLENSTITNRTPTIVISYSAPTGINPSKVFISVNKINLTYFDSTIRGEEELTCPIPPSMELKDGTYNISVSVADNAGHVEKRFFEFHVGNNAKTDGGINFQELAINLLIAIGIGFAGLGVVVLYLRKTRNFTFKKFFAKHPVPKAVFIGVIPAVVAFFFILFAIAFFQGDAKTAAFSTEYILVIALFIALLPYAIFAQKERSTIASYERAFSQFLFEMADAMRGGIDPAKALIELSKTDTSVLTRHLRIAANGIEMGRPFEEMINVMVKPIKSKLIKRYASLIGESAKVGGEISLVVHRAAKDMDDLIKIDQERSRSLMTQATTIYIAFGVMLVILYQLVSIYPSLGQIDLSLFGNQGLEGSGSAAVERMDFTTLKRRFLHLVIISSIGNGLLIGLFTNGKIKYGLIHSLIMVLAAVIFFLIMIL